MLDYTISLHTGKQLHLAARMLPDLHVGEAFLAGQMINFPVLARIKPPLSMGEREEDGFALLEKMRRQQPSATPLPRKPR